jgi:hypothetical protein
LRDEADRLQRNRQNQGRLIRNMFEIDGRLAHGDRFDPFPHFGHFGRLLGDDAHRADDRFHIFMDDEHPFARRFADLQRPPQTLRDIISKVQLTFDQVCFKIFNTEEMFNIRSDKRYWKSITDVFGSSQFLGALLPAFLDLASQ